VFLTNSALIASDNAFSMIELCPKLKLRLRSVSEVFLVSEVDNDIASETFIELPKRVSFVSDVFLRSTFDNVTPKLETKFQLRSRIFSDVFLMSEFDSDVAPKSLIELPQRER